MEFKVGDKVILNKNKRPTHGLGSVNYGDVGTITYIYNQEYWVDFPEHKHWHGEKNDVILKDFTKSDLQDGDIVTYRNGDKAVVLRRQTELRNSNEIGLMYLKDYDEELKYNNNKEYDIIKGERPIQYETVFERKEEILDKAEKRYLRNVIKPFRDRVKSIHKLGTSEKRKEYLFILLTGEEGEEVITLPYFKVNTMYKGMEINKEYSLEELGI